MAKHPIFSMTVALAEDAVVGERERHVAELMGSPGGIFVVDDTGFRKRGNHSCGVGRQYSGTLGKVENCQIGVFLGYAVPGEGHTLLDRRLYLQEDWFAPEMEGRRRRAHMPEGVVFGEIGRAVEPRPELVGKNEKGRRATAPARRRTRQAPLSRARGTMTTGRSASE